MDGCGALTQSMYIIADKAAVQPFQVPRGKLLPPFREGGRKCERLKYRPFGTYFGRCPHRECSKHNISSGDLGCIKVFNPTINL